MTRDALELDRPPHQTDFDKDPKSIGQFIDVVSHVEHACSHLDRPHDLHNAGGICFYNDRDELTGTVTNRVEDRKVYPRDIAHIHVGQEIHRNYDRLFTARGTIRAQLTRRGNTIFTCTDLQLETSDTYFLPASSPFASDAAPAK